LKNKEEGATKGDAWRQIMAALIYLFRSFCFFEKSTGMNAIRGLNTGQLATADIC